SHISGVDISRASRSPATRRSQLLTISWKPKSVFYPSTLRCCSPPTRRSQPSNTSLLFSPHAPKSTLQQFAAVLPSRAKVNPPTLRCCSPLTRPSTVRCGANLAVMTSKHADCCLPSLQKLCTHYCIPDDGQL